MSQPRECAYCGNPIPLDRTKSCGDIDCRLAIASGHTARPMARRQPSLAETLPSSELRYLHNLLIHPFTTRNW